jgi:hypothetical protein
MSYSMNHVVFEGNIGGDIKADFPEDDVAIAKFTIAQYVGAKHKETQKTVPRWWNCRLRSKTNADGNSPAQKAIETLKKGDAVLVEGRISGWIPDEEYDKEAKNSDYKATPVLFVDVTSVRKLVVERSQGGSTSREEMPPF